MTRTVQYSLFAALGMLAFFFYSLAFTSTLFFDDVVSLGGAAGSVGASSGSFFLHSRWAVVFWNYITLSSSGLSVEAFRVQNFILHLLIAFVFLNVFNLVFEHMPHESWIFRWRRSVTLLASGLFLLHPVQAQTALHVAHMRLEGLLVLSALIVCFLMAKAILHEGTLTRNGWLWGSVAFSVLAVGTKESIIVVPLLVFLIDWFFIARGNWEEITKRGLLYGIFCCCFYAAFFLINSKIGLWQLLSGQLFVFSRPGNLLTDSYHTSMSAYSYFLTQIPLLVHYVMMFINPFELCIDYDVPLISTWSHPAVVFGVAFVLLIGLGTAIAWYFKRSNLVSFAILWFGIALFPRVTFVPSSDIVGDYKTFLASVGIMLLLSGVIVWSFEWLTKHTGIFESKVGWGAFLIAIFWGSSQILGVTKEHCLLWCNPVSFWEYVRQHTPGRARTVHNLGVALADVDRMSEAMDCYAQAVNLDENYAHPLVKLGECYQRNGDATRALSYYLRAENVQVQPLAQLHNNKGLLFMEQGDLIRAEDEFKKALAIEPMFAKGLFNYATLLKKLGRFTQAYAVVNECIQHSPHSQDLNVQFLKARLAFEVREFRDVIATLEPRIDEISDSALQFMLASAYYSSENYKKAVDLFEKVYSKRPDNLDVAYNYAQSLMKLERYSAAVPYFQQCNGNDKYPFAPLHAATCLYRNGNYGAARASVETLDRLLLAEPVRAELMLLKRDMRLLA